MEYHSHFTGAFISGKIRITSIDIILSQNVYYPPLLSDASNYVPYDWMLGAIDVVLLQDSQLGAYYA